MSLLINRDNALPCNSTMVALVQSAIGVEHSQLDYEQAFAAGHCQYTGNATLASEAKEIWITASSYGYIPSAGFAAFALAAFSIAALLHCYQLWRSRRWAYIATICGAALQIFGWSQRYVGSQDIQYGYVEQLATLTIAPTFFSATIYALFSMLSASHDPSLLPFMGPRGYMWTFIAIAAITDDPTTFDTGCNTMLAGIILQLITTLVFLVAFSTYYHRLRLSRGSEVLSLRQGTGRIFWGVIFMAAFIIVRGCYRTAELSEGLFGEIATHEAGLIGCDAIPMIIVILLLNATHPLHNLPSASSSSTTSPSRHFELQASRNPSHASSQDSREKMVGTGEAAEAAYGRV
ncbi:hypothetical protein JCM6882_006610 [Rhodosporidiobolus microsporus]